MLLFSPENRPWTLLLFGSVVVLAAYLILSGDGVDGPESGPASSTTTGAGSVVADLGEEASGPEQEAVTAGVLTSDECVTAASSLSLAASGGVPPAGPVDAQAVADSFARMSATAPPEIQDDLAVMSAGLSQFFAILVEEGVDLSDPAGLSSGAPAAALQRAASAVDLADLSDAAANVDAWFRSVCGAFVPD